MTLIHVEGQAAANSAEGVKNPGRLGADADIYRDKIALASDAGRSELGSRVVVASNVQLV